MVRTQLFFLILFLSFNERLPDVMGSHYNLKGEQDGTMPKWGFWLMYIGLGVAMPTILSVMRYVDPRRDNYTRFEDYFYIMRWAISLFLHGVLLVVILTNLGYELPMMNLVVGAMGILWLVIGNRMGQLRSNFFIGVRTPWALTDENNWRLTHRLSARLWFLAGLIMFASAWFVPAAWITVVLLICVLCSSLIPTVYSYVLHSRKKKA
ncbi:SdpI family protein [Cohnella kolymensis]|nr:SdpI family protein [Cohnella kolymensis]